MNNHGIDRLHLYRLRLQLRQPWRTAYGVESTVETLLLQLKAGEECAWYESTPLRFPDYSPACAASSFALIREHLAPLVLGRRPAEVATALAAVRGNTFARDLLVGAADALNATFPPGSDRPRSTVTLSLQSPDLVARAAAYRHRQIRLKFTSPDDLPVLCELRNALPKSAIGIDCNAAFSLAHHLPLFRQLDELQLTFIEQPLHHRDLVHHAKLQAQLATPICLDESITCPHDAASAIEIGAAKVFNLKPGRVGGPDRLREILALARANQIGCFIGGMLESPLGVHQNARLATLPGITLPSDLPNPADRYQALPIQTTLTHTADGRVAISDPPVISVPDLAPFIIHEAKLTH